MTRHMPHLPVQPLFRGDRRREKPEKAVRALIAAPPCLEMDRAITKPLTAGIHAGSAAPLEPERRASPVAACPPIMP